MLVSRNPTTTDATPEPPPATLGQQILAISEGLRQEITAGRARRCRSLLDQLEALAPVVDARRRL